MTQENDIALLRRFEPVLRFTRGERFFPMDVEPYVRVCSLWGQRRDEEAVLLVPQGELNLSNLARPHPDEFGSVQFLKLTDPLSPQELVAYRLKDARSRKDPRDVFHAGTGRLARVGYLSRFVDALFAISLLARGRVPGDVAAAANITYQRLMANKPTYCYYGRVVRQNGWTVLQYWFFYLFDDWRSSFFGANDHEADWEMVCVYVSEDETGETVPEWTAFAAHDEAGNDIRRRWDDPELEKLGDHPVVYVGAGSHASYFRAGEYPTEVELPFLASLIRITDRLQRFWRENLRQYVSTEKEGKPGDAASLFRVAFVDYARGDGISIGPGQKVEWGTPRLLSPAPPWVTSYRGLWGFYAHDPYEGEDAPAGPMYNRDGTVRAKWYDPVGWSGLNTVPTQRQALAALQCRLAELRERRDAARDILEMKRRQLTALATDLAALRGHPQLSMLHDTRVEEVGTLSEELDGLQAQIASDQTLVETLESYEQRLRDGERESPRAHLLHPSEPASESELRLGRIAEAWAAASVGLMMIAFVAIIIFAREYLIQWLIGVVSLYVAIEAYFRHRLTALIAGVTIGLAIVSAAIIVYEFFWPMAVLAVLIAGFYILFQNLRELWT